MMVVMATGTATTIDLEMGISIEITISIATMIIAGNIIIANTTIAHTIEILQTLDARAKAAVNHTTIDRIKQQI